MPKLPNSVSSNTNSLRKLFSGLLSLDDRPRRNIEDDWELIEFLDRELAGEEGRDGIVDEEDIEMADQDEAECSYFTCSQNVAKMKYTILSKAEIRQRLEHKITKVSTVLMLSRNEAAILLQHFQWAVNRAYDEWLACEEKVRKEVGLFVKPVAETPAHAAQIACRICHVEFQSNLMYSGACGHRICRSCWQGYISDAINDGPQCLTLRCPELSCDAAVGLYLIELLSSENDKKKLENHLLRSYIASNRKAKWCPSPYCNYAVFFSYCGEGNVTCRCLHSFCWSCSREVHDPVDCGTLAEWISQSVIQSENWVLAKTTTCPNCKTKFEEASSFMLVDCISCNHLFCRVCGANSWETCKQSCTFFADNVPEDSAEYSLERYSYYYEGWATCESSREKALTKLKALQDVELNFLYATFGLFPNELDFLVEALEKVIRCWQILKHTHVYGYFLPGNDDAKKELFVFLQDYATSLVGQLHKHVDDLYDLLYASAPYIHFVECRNKIITLTRVSKNYFDKLVEGLMAGLPEVEPIPELSPMLEAPREEGENSYIRENPNPSPSSSPFDQITRGVDDININSPVGRTKSDDPWVKSSPVSEHKLQLKSEFKYD